MSDIPEWAKERVRQMIGREEVEDLHEPAKETIGRAFARYIAEHEGPPVDPLLIEAREIAAVAVEGAPGRFTFPPKSYREGERDDEPGVKAIIAALKRGMELAREAKP